MTGALAYLIACSVRNSIRLRVRQLGRPRYLLIAVVLILYVGSMLHNRRNVATMPFVTALEDHARLIGSVIAFGLLGLAWVLPGAAALRFTITDVHFLFPAPIARRHLLGYKIVRLLVGALATSAVLTLFIGPARPLSALIFALKSALIIGIISLHEAGVSLYRTNRKDTGPLSPARQLGVLAGALLVAVLGAWTATTMAFATGRGGLLRAASLGVAFLALNIAWILRSDAAFEEEAAHSAEKIRRATLRGPVARPRTSAVGTTQFPLAPRGPFATAILWKNALTIRRQSGTAWMLPAAVTVLFLGSFMAAGGSNDGTDAVAFLALVLAVFAVLLGPMLLRFDLRQDLANLALIKSWPVTGAAVVRGEVLAPAILISAAAAIATIAGGVFAPADMLPVLSTAIGRLTFIVAATSVAAALIVAHLVIQNAIAVTFPGWVRVTPAGAGGGFEAMGQTMVVSYGAMLVLLLGAIVPATAAALAYYVAGGTLLPAGVFTVLMLVEAGAATEIVGGILDRTDVHDVPMPE